MANTQLAASEASQSGEPLDPRKQLELKVHGRVLEHLGIQMYESPVNAVAELIANAWDADADKVEISLPSKLGADAVISIHDDGIGMTPQDCQNRYLYVGLNRRGDNPDARSSEKNRHVLGRKGIGKFAGFGIAHVMSIDSISKATGERILFDLSLDELMGQEYIGPGSKQITVREYNEPDESRKTNHGTTITLKSLKLSQKTRSDFPKSMARRFLLLQRQSGFTVLVDKAPLPTAIELDKVQYAFPRDYELADRPDALTLVDEEGKTVVGTHKGQVWGLEKVGDKLIKWRMLFHKETLPEEELRGVTVFANGKLVQSPFLFQLSGGLGGQHGLEYLTGQVEADYLDQLSDDLVTTERQRVNWDHAEALPLLHWGQERVKTLLAKWKELRGEGRRKQIEDKIATFASRLENLPKSEQKTIRQALSKLGSISTLSDEEFNSLGTAVLTAWEQGRLKDLISNIAESSDLSSEKLLALFNEMDVLTALNVAEAIQTRLSAVGELQRRVDAKHLENPVRDYIAEHPYLLAPEYETFRVERHLEGFLAEMNAKVDMPEGTNRKRVDLLLSSGQQLILFEFMRPGLQLDWEHLNRYELYFRTIQTNLLGNTGGRFSLFTGYVIADRLDQSAVLLKKVQDMRRDNMFAMDWNTLVRNTFKQYEEHFEALLLRSPNDDRLKALAKLRSK